MNQPITNLIHRETAGFAVLGQRAAISRHHQQFGFSKQHCKPTPRCASVFWDMQWRLQMGKPDSILSAARQLAAGAGMPWAEVQHYYRALQEPGGSTKSPWIPKSHGRNIWAAHPHFIARVLFALAGARSPDDVHEAVEMIREMTPNGRKKYLTEQDAVGVLAPMERLFFKYLTDVTSASDLRNIEFRLDEGTVIINTKSEGEITYSRPVVPGEGSDQPPRPFRAIYTRGVIHGAVFVFLASTVSWRLSDQPPFEDAKPDDELDD